MKKIILFASISHLALIAGGAANAADLPVKAPPMVAAPAYSWTGCYAGAHLGWGWDHRQVTDSNWSYGGGIPISATNTLDSNSGIYGGQVGCNYQFAGNWVAGIQGDIAGTNFSGTVADPFDRFNLNFPPPGTLGVKTEWIASLTARLGITAWNNQALFYVKGGAAWDKNRWDLSNSSYCRFYDGCLNYGPDDSRTGWTVGGGVEWVISPTWRNWTAFAEYNYYEFNDGPGYAVGLTFLDPRNAITPAKQQIQTVKVGINYKLYSP